MGLNYGQVYRNPCGKDLGWKGWCTILWPCVDFVNQRQIGYTLKLIMSRNYIAERIAKDFYESVLVGWTGFAKTKRIFAY